MLSVYWWKWQQTDGESCREIRADKFRAVNIRYLLEFLGNTHACVNSLPSFSVLCLIVLQEVTSGELGGNEARQRWIWNNVRATVLWLNHCPQQIQLSTQWELQRWLCKVEERGGSISVWWKLKSEGLMAFLSVVSVFDLMQPKHRLGQLIYSVCGLSLFKE